MLCAKSVKIFARLVLSSFHLKIIFSAAVPSRIEYGKMCIESCILVNSKFRCFLSFPLETLFITSVVIEGLSKYCRSMVHTLKNNSVSYFLFIFLSISSLPLCNERWKCGFKFSNFERVVQKSSVIMRGSKEPSLKRIFGKVSRILTKRLCRLSHVFRKMQFQSQLKQFLNIFVI